MDVAGHKFVTKLKKGYRMEPPIYAPNMIRNIMCDCWKANPKDRPTFTQLEDIISQTIEASVSEFYLELNSSYAKLNEERRTPLSNYFKLSSINRTSTELERRYHFSRTVPPVVRRSDHTQRKTMSLIKP